MALGGTGPGWPGESAAAGARLDTRMARLRTPGRRLSVKAEAACSWFVPSVLCALEVCAAQARAAASCAGSQQRRIQSCRLYVRQAHSTSMVTLASPRRRKRRRRQLGRPAVRNGASRAERQSQSRLNRACRLPPALRAIHRTTPDHRPDHSPKKPHYIYTSCFFPPAYVFFNSFSADPDSWLWGQALEGEPPQPACRR